MRSLASRFVLCAAALVVLTPHDARAQKEFIAPSELTITSETEERDGARYEHLIYILNRSTVPVTVFSVRLSGCENVKQHCDPRRVNLRIGPGQRRLAMRVQPDNPERGFRYAFGFSWRDSSSSAALAVLASSGDPRSQERLDAARRADSMSRAETGRRYNELTRDDFKVLASQIASLRADPESLVIVPGQPASIESIKILVLDSARQVLGRARWLRYMVVPNQTVQFTPPSSLQARAPGRTIVRFSLASEAQALLSRELAEIEVPVVAAFPYDPNAPAFTGLAVDAGTRRPLGCVAVALEDSAQNVVVRDRTQPSGMFVLQAPRPGTYRLRFDAHGWSPVYGPEEVAKAGEEKQREYLVRFDEQLLVTREMFTTDFQHASPAAVTAPIPTGSRSGAARTATTPIVQGVTLGGSSSNPILGIISKVPPTTTFMQFVVDSVGRVDTASVTLPPDTEATARASILSILPRVRFSPAREAGKPVCEMLRMQVNVTHR